jgi:4-nitrophenyl phosphatase/NagD protein
MFTPESLHAVRCFLLDMDGTFYLGERLLPGALDFIETLRRQGRDYLFLTNNSSKDAALYADKLRRLGLEAGAEKVFTSGAATAMYLRERRPGARVYLAGTPALAAEFETRGFTLTAEAPDVAVLGFDTTLTYERLWRLCDLARAGVPFVATHPDINCPTETGYMPDIGAMLAAIQASTGRAPDVIVGKPNRLIVEQAAARLGLPVSALAMVGDRLYTDIALGPAAGIPSVLVLSGESTAGDAAVSPFRPTATFAHLGELAAYLQTNPQTLAPAARAGVTPMDADQGQNNSATNDTNFTNE